MSVRTFVISVLVALLAGCGSKPAAKRDADAGAGSDESGAFAGYTLLAPLISTTTYLIDMQGRVVHTWKSEYPPGQSAYLLENGHLLRTASSGRHNGTFHAGGAGGRVQEFAWDGSLVWDFVYVSDEHLLHHDIERLPNGNTLMIAWEAKTREEAIAAGRDPDVQGDGVLWSDYVIEVKPTGPTTGEIVWEWHVWDHLIQDHDPGKANYGVVGEHPERIDVNPIDWADQLSEEEREKLEAIGYLDASTRPRPGRANPDWNHTNSVAYNADLDQIVLSVLGFNEIWVIDHSTTTAEAAGSTGGRGGKGGDLLYRWGNPRTYRVGTSADQRLFAQHDAQWIPSGRQGAGNLLVFNNGRGRSDGGYSSVDEITPPADAEGRYAWEPGLPFAPSEPVWRYTAANKPDFYSSHISGAQRLPNGNTLICSGETGRLFEVTPEKDIVWEYTIPTAGGAGPPDRRGPAMGPGAEGMGASADMRGRHGPVAGRTGYGPPPGGQGMGSQPGQRGSGPQGFGPPPGARGMGRSDGTRMGSRPGGGGFGRRAGAQGFGSPPGGQGMGPQRGRGGFGPGAGSQGFGSPPEGQGMGPQRGGGGFGRRAGAQGFGSPPGGQGMGQPPDGAGMGPPPGRGPRNEIFRVCRYASDYPGLAGKDLAPGPALEALIAAESPAPMDAHQRGEGRSVSPRRGGI